MTLTFNGSNNTIGGLAAGGLPDASVVKADLAADVAGTQGKILGMHQVTYKDQQRSLAGDWADTGIEIAYTPVASNSTAILTFSSYQRADSGNYAFLGIRQAGAIHPSSASNDYGVAIAGNSTTWLPCCFSIQITPSWTAGSETTFQIYWRTWTSASNCYLGWGTSFTNGDKYEHFRIEEIAA